MGIDILYVSMSDEASFFGDLFLYEVCLNITRSMCNAHWISASI